MERPADGGQGSQKVLGLRYYHPHSQFSKQRVQRRDSVDEGSDLVVGGVDYRKGDDHGGHCYSLPQ